jgi:hypothetical protein
MTRVRFNNKIHPPTELNHEERTPQKPPGRKTLANTIAGGCPGKGQYEMIDPGAYTEAVLHHQRSDFPKPVIKTKNDLRKSSIYYH